MIKHHIMNNRRHVLTKDSSGNVELWDITRVYPITLQFIEQSLCGYRESS